MTDITIGDWTYIPESAFLYFPQGEEVIVPNRKSPQKQWRKIFGGGVEYTPYENKCLKQLDQELAAEKIQLDPFFTPINKLRFLQANKFKVEKTIESMSQNTKWRASAFPIQPDAKTQKLLNSGAFYFCGRDQKYRPILVVDIGKFDEDADQDDSIQMALVVVVEFMINQLLIEGQVENYCIIMNLQKASFSYRGVITKILSFTSNAYRGRLFASYLLSMPAVIRWGWDAIISKFVSENTLKKLKITGDPWHDDMWTHIHKETIEQRYGGDMSNLLQHSWPPKKELLLYTRPQNDAQNNLMTPEEYYSLFIVQKLPHRKILRSFVEKQKQKQEAVAAQKRQQEEIQLQEQKMISEMVIRKQTNFNVDTKIIQTFFQFPSFLKICNIS